MIFSNFRFLVFSVILISVLWLHPICFSFNHSLPFISKDLKKAINHLFNFLMPCVWEDVCVYTDGCVWMNVLEFSKWAELVVCVYKKKIIFLCLQDAVLLLQYWLSNSGMINNSIVVQYMRLKVSSSLQSLPRYVEDSCNGSDLLSKMEFQSYSF